MEKRKTNSAGSIYYDKSRKKYRGQIVIGYHNDGTPIKRSTSGKTKSEVRTKLERIKNDPNNGLDPTKITLYNLTKEMLDEQLERNEIKESSHHRNLESLKIYENLSKLQIQKITESQLKEFIYGHSYYSQSTINKFYQLISRAFKEAVEREIIVKNPMDRVKCPRSSKRKIEVRAFTCEEQKKFLTVLNTNDILYKHQMIISLFTGMRMGEINALSIEDIDLYNNTIYINKTVSTGSETVISETTKTTASTREIYIPEEVSALFKKLISERKEGLLFSINGGKPIRTTLVNGSFKAVLKKYNILDRTVRGRIDLHSLRHTYATRCLESGMEPKVLQGILGHTDISTTMNTYCSVFKEYNMEHINKATSYLRTSGLLQILA